MSWRLAKSLEQLRHQVDTLVPGRDKSSDGSIGDAAHASRSSDHNPWVKDGSMGVVTAIDITHDPKGGFNSYAFADMLCSEGHRDPRIKYIISNRRFASGDHEDNPAWVWRPYSGTNPHDHHIHISVKPDKGHYDSAAEWAIGAMATPSARAPGTQSDDPMLRQGASGPPVAVLQALLIQRGFRIKADAKFGEATLAAVRAFQSKSLLTVDGVVGGYTWRALRAGAS